MFEIPPQPSRLLQSHFNDTVQVSYERKVRTVPLTRPLQIGHFLNDGAHSLHTTRCPQGMKTMLTSLSMHTLQVRSSCRRRSCSSMGRSEKRTVQNYVHIIVFYTSLCGNNDKRSSAQLAGVVIPERSWLGDEASLDWAKGAHLNSGLEHSSNSQTAIQSSFSAWW